MSLIKSLETPSEINESKWLQQLHAKLKSKSSETPAEPEKNNAATDYHESESSLATVAAEILDVPSGFQRVIYFTDHTSLRQRYLVAGGSGVKMLEGLDDAALQNMATLAGSSPLIALPQNFYMKQMVAPPANVRADRAILINAPTSLVAELKSAGNDVQKVKVALSKMLSHRHYMMTLNMPAVFKLGLQNTWAQGISADQAAETLDPAILENYPVAARLASMKLEWKKRLAQPAADREAQVAGKEQEADWNRRERDAEASSRPNETEIEKTVTAQIAKFHETADGEIQPESFVKNYLDREFNFSDPKKMKASKEDVADAVDAIRKKLRIPNLDKVSEILRRKI